MIRVTRRAAIRTALLGGAAACARTPQRQSFEAAVGPQTDAFLHGVASGDPEARSVVLWTRYDAGALSGADGEATVAYEVAREESFADILASGEATTGPAADWTIKVVARDLEPGGRYFYRFRAGDALSPVGRTRTLPEGRVEAARFAVVSCSNYPFGFFNVYDHIARREDVDAVIHLGDYIYEYGPDGYGGAVGERLGRPHDPPREIITLEDYRRRHAQYKADPASRAMHAAHPLIAIWDDHETSNNSWRDGAENHDPASEGDWAARKRAALQAYYEWMPIREPEPGRTREAIFRAFPFGDLLTVVALETRLMARTEQIDLNDVAAGLKTPEDVDRFRREVLGDPSRELLGPAQLAFLEDAFLRSRNAGQPWRIIANQIIMAEVIAPDLAPHVTEAEIVELQAQWDQARAFVETSKLGLPTNLDAWDGYPAARERFYELATRTGARDGMIVVTGDTHTWWANDLKTGDGAPVGVELGVNSVTSPSPYRKSFLGGKGAEYALLTNKENKAVRYLSGEDHGYIDLNVRRDGAEARFMAVDTIEAPAYAAFEKVSFRIRKKDGAAAFAGADGLTLKERLLF